jgi:hypothetical protein
MPKRKKLSQEEIQAQALVRELGDLRERLQFIPVPPSNRIYPNGTRVQHGHIEKSIVTDTLEAGRIVLLHQEGVTNHYGELIPFVRDMYVSWLDITPWRSPEDNKAISQFSTSDSLQLTYSQRSMADIFSKMYHFGLDMNPDYQRGNVWTHDDKLNLISSIFDNVDIGKFVFIQLPYKADSPTYEVLDGKQRIIALCEFFENRFPWRRKCFSELCYRDQGHFEEYHISVATVRNEDVKLSDKYLYFLRLNTGGKLQDPKHVERVRKLYEAAIAEGK